MADMPHHTVQTYRSSEKPEFQCLRRRRARTPHSCAFSNGHGLQRGHRDSSIFQRRRLCTYTSHLPRSVRRAVLCAGLDRARARGTVGRYRVYRALTFTAPGRGLRARSPWRRSLWLRAQSCRSIGLLGCPLGITFDLSLQFLLGFGYPLGITFDLGLPVPLEALVLL